MDTEHTVELENLTQLTDNQPNIIQDELTNDSERHHDNFTRPSEA